MEERAASGDNVCVFEHGLASLIIMCVFVCVNFLLYQPGSGSGVEVSVGEKVTVSHWRPNVKLSAITEMEAN